MDPVSGEREREREKMREITGKKIELMALIWWRYSMIRFGVDILIKTLKK